jgi:2-C-methyl-D-erythritol 4-phosphate cytidylyltransferase
MDCIMLAAGIGRRTGLGYPKQLLMFAGKPVLIHSMELFEKRDDIDNIVVTAIPDDDCEYRYKYLFKQYGIKKAKVIKGGDTRQESVRLALEHVKSEYVIIHEAVRPFIEQKFIDYLIARKGLVVVPIIDVPFTTVNFLYHEHRCEFYRSCNIKNVQLPQKFNRVLLTDAHGQRWGENFSDDASLVSDFKKDCEITFIDGSDANIKITSPLDVRIAEVLYEEFSGSYRR